jgi:hypothetical protein
MCVSYQRGNGSNPNLPVCKYWWFALVLHDIPENTLKYAKLAFSAVAHTSLLMITYTFTKIADLSKCLILPVRRQWYYVTNGAQSDKHYEEEEKENMLQKEWNIYINLLLTPNSIGHGGSIHTSEYIIHQLYVYIYSATFRPNWPWLG